MQGRTRQAPYPATSSDAFFKQLERKKAAVAYIRMRKPYKQYGAIPFRLRKGKLEVLLITSRRSKRWIFPKGWPNGSPRNTAKAEAYEEAGVKGKVGRRALGAVKYRKKLGRRKVKCHLKIFPLAVRRRTKSWPERRQRESRWFGLKDAAAKCFDPALGRLVRKFRRSGVTD